MKITKFELKEMICEALREELSYKTSRKKCRLKESFDCLAEDTAQQIANILNEYGYTGIDAEDVADALEPLLSSFDDNEVLDVSASEVDDLARDVYVDDAFDTAYQADGNTIGNNVAQLVVDVLEYEYPDYDLGKVPDRVLDALRNMLEDGLL